MSKGGIWRGAGVWRAPLTTVDLAACSSCKKRGCADVCPGGTLKPLGRVSKAALEVRLAPPPPVSAVLLTLSPAQSIAWQKRAEELEAIIRAAGMADKVPAPLELGKKGKVEVPEAASAHEEDGNLLVAGVGSLTIKDDGTTRFLGLSAGSAYFVKVSWISSEGERSS